MTLASIVSGRPALAVICIAALVLLVVAFGGMIRDAGRRR